MTTGYPCKENEDPAITHCCEVGQECIIYVNLKTEGKICSNSDCGTFLVNPEYVINDLMWMQICFADKSYKKYLNFKRCMF